MNLIQLFVSLMFHCSQNVFCRFPGILIEKTTFEEQKEIYEQILKELEIHYNHEKEIIDSNIDLLTNFY